MAIPTTAIATSRGFTLIEVLVVLLIMALLVGLVTAIVRPDDSGRLRVEAERLAQLLALAAEQSRLTGKSIAWMADGPGYQFWRMTTEGEWSELRDSDLLRARTLPQGMMISDLKIENMPARSGMRLEFSPYDAALSFTIKMTLGAAHYAVVSSPIGAMQVTPGEGGAGEQITQR